jgi:hypothetical protein
MMMMMMMMMVKMATTTFVDDDGQHDLKAAILVVMKTEPSLPLTLNTCAEAPESRQCNCRSDARPTRFSFRKARCAQGV